jgi:hypothetical protein
MWCPACEERAISFNDRLVKPRSCCPPAVPPSRHARSPAHRARQAKHRDPHAYGATMNSSARSLRAACSRLWARCRS